MAASNTMIVGVLMGQGTKRSSGSVYVAAHLQNFDARLAWAIALFVITVITMFCPQKYVNKGVGLMASWHMFFVGLLLWAAVHNSTAGLLILASFVSRIAVLLLAIRKGW